MASSSSETDTSTSAENATTSSTDKLENIKSKPSLDVFEAVDNKNIIDNVVLNAGFTSDSEKSINLLHAEDGAFKTNFLNVSSKEEPSSPSTLSKPSVTNSSRLEKTIGALFEDNRTTCKTDISLESEKYKLKFCPISKQIPVRTVFNPSENSSFLSSTKEVGNLFKDHCAELDVSNNKSSLEVDSSSLSVFSSEKLTHSLKNLSFKMPVKFEGLFMEGTISAPNFNNESPNSCQVPSGTTLEFKPYIDHDTMTIAKPITVRHQCISMMREYSGKSLEELRFEDYKENRKGIKSNFTLKTGGFFVPNLIEFTPLEKPNEASEATNTFHFAPTGTSGVRRLLQGLKDLLLSGKHSDVTLNVQGKHFNVHKNILAIWSPPFYKMMNNESKENVSRVVNIDDCSPDIFSDFLHFLYTGSAKTVNAKNVSDLYTIAKKYQVYELSTVCAKYIENNSSQVTKYPLLFG